MEYVFKIVKGEIERWERSPEKGVKE